MTPCAMRAGNAQGQGSVIGPAGKRAGQMVVADSVGQFIIVKTNGFRSFPLM